MLPQHRADSPMSQTLHNLAPTNIDLQIFAEIDLNLMVIINVTCV